MRKMKMYGKTRRTEDVRVQYYLYEKIDGANLGIAKINNQLIVCQRNNIIEDFNEITYGGLKEWIEKYKDEVLDAMNDNTIIFGEWLGTSKYKTEIKFYHFASAQIIAGTTVDTLCPEKLGPLNYIGKEYGFYNNDEWDNRHLVYDALECIEPVPLIFVKDEPFINEDYDTVYYGMMNRKSVVSYDTICEGFVMVDYKNNPLKIVYAKNGG